MILSADPSLLGLGFGVTGTVDAANIDRAFVLLLGFRPFGPSHAPPRRCWMGSLRTSRSLISHRPSSQAAGIVA